MLIPGALRLPLEAFISQSGGGGTQRMGLKKAAFLPRFQAPAPGSGVEVGAGHEEKKELSLHRSQQVPTPAS